MLDIAANLICLHVHTLSPGEKRDSKGGEDLSLIPFLNFQLNAKGPAGRWSSLIFHVFRNVRHFHWWSDYISTVEENAEINSSALQNFL